CAVAISTKDVDAAVRAICECNVDEAAPREMSNGEPADCRSCRLIAGRRAKAAIAVSEKYHHGIAGAYRQIGCAIMIEISRDQPRRVLSCRQIAPPKRYIGGQ